MNPTPEHNPRLPPLQRLASSRERIRVTLRQEREEQEQHHPSALMSALLAIPGARAVVETVSQWWAHHPMHVAGTVASNAARSMMRPMARRNPFGLILAAVAVGGLVYWLKPWRFIMKSAVVASIVPQLVARAVNHMPIESWLATLAAMVSLRRHDREDQAEAAREQASEDERQATQPATPDRAAPAAAQPHPDGSAPREPTHTPPGTLH